MTKKKMPRTKAEQKARLGTKRPSSRSTSKARHRAYQGPRTRTGK